MLQVGRSPVRVPDEVDFFNLPNPSSRNMALGSTQRPTEMSTRKRSGGNKRPPTVSRMSQNVGASTSHNPKGLHGLYGDNFTYDPEYRTLHNYHHHENDETYIV
jgi:hypothetical protein